MNRRHALALASLGFAASCRRPAPPVELAAPPAAPLEGADLFIPEIDPALEIRTIAGLRPFRPSGFVVRREDLPGKALIHHYGHGGGGMTLSWGTAHQAVRLAGEVSGRDCTIAGGGVMGLSTARLLQLRGARVTLVSKSLPPDTTSNVAGAQWWPFSVFDPGRRTEEFGRQFVEAAHLSYLEFQRLVGPRWGVRWLPNYYLSDRPHGSGWMTGPGGALHDLQVGFRDFGPGEHAFPLPHVRKFHTMMIEPSTYLATLLGEVVAAGARIEVRDVPDADTLRSLPGDCIFNCTGLGAGPLAADPELIPIKGQLSLLMPRAEMNYNLIHGDHYLFPRADGIVLGGTYVKGATDTTPDPAARDRILAAHRSFFERFRSARETAAAG